MANFTKILIGEEAKPYMFNLDAIESLDLERQRVYTVGSNMPYRVYDYDSWQSLLNWVNTHKCPNYHC